MPIVSNFPTYKKFTAEEIGAVPIENDVAKAPNTIELKGYIPGTEDDRSIKIINDPESPNAFIILQDSYGSPVTITNVAYPTDNSHAANKEYVDNMISTQCVQSVNGIGGSNIELLAEDVGALPVTGGKIESPDVGGYTNIQPSNIALSKDNAGDIGFFIDASESENFKPIACFYGLTGDELTVLRNIAQPEGDSDAANKQYVDDAIAAAIGTAIGGSY